MALDMNDIPQDCLKVRSRINFQNPERKGEDERKGIDEFPKSTTVPIIKLYLLGGFLS